MLNEVGGIHEDHQSDPAHTPGEGWGDEGGASHLGPATHLDAGHAHDEDLEVDGADIPGTELD